MDGIGRLDAPAVSPPGKESAEPVGRRMGGPQSRSGPDVAETHSPIPQSR
jgi:hypothetical protein